MPSPRPRHQVLPGPTSCMFISSTGVHSCSDGMTIGLCDITVVESTVDTATAASVAHVHDQSRSIHQSAKCMFHVQCGMSSLPDTTTIILGSNSISQCRFTLQISAVNADKGSHSLMSICQSSASINTCDASNA